MGLDKRTEAENYYYYYISSRILLLLLLPPTAEQGFGGFASSSDIDGWKDWSVYGGVSDPIKRQRHLLLSRRRTPGWNSVWVEEISGNQT